MDCRLESGNLQGDTIIICARTVRRGGQDDHIACFAIRADFRARAPHVDYALVGGLILTSADVVIIDENRGATQHARGSVTCRALLTHRTREIRAAVRDPGPGFTTSATFTMRRCPGFASSIPTSVSRVLFDQILKLLPIDAEDAIVRCCIGGLNLAIRTI